MNFDDQLSQMVSSVDGAQAAVLMGFDGIPVAEAKADASRTSVQETVVEYSRILTEAVNIARAGDLGAVGELVIGTDRYRLIFRIVDPNYFVVLFLSADSNIGKGRFILRRAMPAIQRELA